MQEQIADRFAITTESVTELIEKTPDPFTSDPVRIKNAAIKVIGAIHSLALAEGIVPPEAAINELPEEMQHRALDLFEAATDPDGEKPKKTMEPDTSKRIGRVLTYVVKEDTRIGSS